MSSSVVDASDEALILSRAIEAEHGGWSVDVARGILSLSLSDVDRARE